MVGHLNIDSNNKLTPHNQIIVHSLNQIIIYADKVIVIIHKTMGIYNLNSFKKRENALFTYWTDLLKHSSRLVYAIMNRDL